jgi:hypothetical protein
MPNSPKRPGSCLLFVLLVLSGSPVAADQYGACKRDIQRIWNENVTLRGFNKKTLEPFFYPGYVERFDGAVPRFMSEGNITDDIYVTFTYRGKFESRTIVLSPSTTAVYV